MPTRESQAPTAFAASAASGRARSGLLQAGLLDTPHSLTEGRVIYELGQVSVTTAGTLAQILDLDPGHLSRVLAGLSASGRWRASAPPTTVAASSCR